MVEDEGDEDVVGVVDRGLRVGRMQHGRRTFYRGMLRRGLGDRARPARDRAADRDHRSDERRPAGRSLEVRAAGLVQSARHFPHQHGCHRRKNAARTKTRAAERRSAGVGGPLVAFGE